MADIAERQANGVAALDRALEARLGEFDRAFATRRAHIEGTMTEAEGRLTDAFAEGVAEFKRTASAERRLLHEEAAAQLAELDGAVRQHIKKIEEVATVQLAWLGQLGELDARVQELEREASARQHDRGTAPG